MLTIQKLTDLANSTYTEIMEEKKQEERDAILKKESLHALHNEIYQNVIEPYMETMRLVGFKIRNYDPRYTVNIYPTAIPTLRLQYADGAHGTDNIYFNINTYQSKPNIKFSGVGVTSMIIDAKDVSMYDIILTHAVKESMILMSKYTNV